MADNAGVKSLGELQNLTITSLQELQSYSKGKIIELPPFSDGQPFVARLIRPSMLALVKDGKIPNSLLVTANTLFNKGGNGLDEDNGEMMSQVFGVMDSLCEASFAEPTYQEIKEAGVKITDEQMMFVFNYSQSGVKALDSFRK